MLRVSEARLKELPGDVLKEFMEKDYMFLIHMHRMSLDNFRLLLDRSQDQETPNA